MAVACGTLALLFIACNHSVAFVKGGVGLFALAVCMNLLMISLMVIPVLWIVAHYFPSLLWYSYLIAYVIELLIIFIVRKVGHLKFELPAKDKD